MDHVVNILGLVAYFRVQLLESLHELEPLSFHYLRDFFIKLLEHLLFFCNLVIDILLNVHHLIFELIHGKSELSQVICILVLLKSLLIYLDLLVHLH